MMCLIAPAANEASGNSFSTPACYRGPTSHQTALLQTLQALLLSSGKETLADVARVIAQLQGVYGTHACLEEVIQALVGIQLTEQMKSRAG